MQEKKIKIKIIQNRTPELISENNNSDNKSSINCEWLSVIFEWMYTTWAGTNSVNVSTCFNGKISVCNKNLNKK